MSALLEVTLVMFGMRSDRIFTGSEEEVLQQWTILPLFLPIMKGVILSLMVTMVHKAEEILAVT